MDHPMTTRIERTGYPKPEKECIGVDAFNNEVFPGDAVYQFEDETFLADALDIGQKEILEIVGADYKELQ